MAGEGVDPHPDQAADKGGQHHRRAAGGPVDKENPAIPLLGSETASCVSSRGEYFFLTAPSTPVSDWKGEGKSDFQVSSYFLLVNVHK